MHQLNQIALGRCPASSWETPQASDTVEDVIISTSAAYHLIRPVRTSFDSRLVLYVWLDRIEGNLLIYSVEQPDGKVSEQKEQFQLTDDTLTFIDSPTSKRVFRRDKRG